MDIEGRTVSALGKGCVMAFRNLLAEFRRDPRMRPTLSQVRAFRKGTLQTASLASDWSMERSLPDVVLALSWRGPRVLASETRRVVFDMVADGPKGHGTFDHAGVEGASSSGRILYVSMPDLGRTSKRHELFRGERLGAMYDFCRMLTDDQLATVCETLFRKDWQTQEEYDAAREQERVEREADAYAARMVRREAVGNGRFEFRRGVLVFVSEAAFADEAVREFRVAAFAAVGEAMRVDEEAGGTAAFDALVESVSGTPAALEMVMQAAARHVEILQRRLQRKLERLEAMRAGTYVKRTTLAQRREHDRARPLEL
jgi:hypothetical protein